MQLKKVFNMFKPLPLVLGIIYLCALLACMLAYFDVLVA